MFQLVTRRPCALGNGNRAEGEVLGSIELAEGVTQQELINAVANLATGITKLSKAQVAPPAPESEVASELDPREAPLKVLGLSKRIEKALAAHGLATAGAIADEGEARQGLSHIAGISESDEEKIVAALKAVFGEEGDEEEDDGEQEDNPPADL